MFNRKTYLFYNLIFIFLFTIVKCLDGGDTIDKSKKLIFVHVIYRHGDRTPIETYPNDPWGNVSYWPVGWGQLTNRGMKQHYELGQWLRNRYHHLIPEKYSKDIVYIRSTDVDRTLMSALSNLAGLFPPATDQRWNDAISWQPIPVHTTPESDDELLAAKRYCPAYEYAFRKLHETDEFKKLYKKLKPLYEYLTNMTGRKINSLFSLQNLYNCLYIEDLYNFTLPDWTKSVYPDGDMKSVSEFTFKISTYTPQLARLKSGFLLKEILEHSLNKTTLKLHPDRSMWIYSAHDTTIASVLNILGLFEPHTPPYTACILFELNLIKKVPHISVYYKNTTDNPKALYIPNCGYDCPLDKMYELYRAVLPVDFDSECEMSMLAMTYDDVDLSLNWGFTVAAVLLTLAMIIYATVSFCQRRAYPDSRWYLKIDS